MKWISESTVYRRLPRRLRDGVPAPVIEILGPERVRRLALVAERTSIARDGVIILLVSSSGLIERALAATLVAVCGCSPATAPTVMMDTAPQSSIAAPATPPGRGRGAENSSVIVVRDDPVREMKTLLDSVQAELDDVSQPFNQGVMTIDSVWALPGELFVPRGPIPNRKKIYAEARKVAAGGVANIDALGLVNSSSREKAHIHFESLHTLVTSIRKLNESTARVDDKIAQVVPRMRVLASQAIARARAISSDPTASSADKARADADSKFAADVAASLQGRIDRWQRELRDLPKRAEDLVALMSRSFQ